MPSRGMISPNNALKSWRKIPPKDLKNLGTTDQGFVASHGKKHSPPPTPGVIGPSAKGERYAIVIGINDYPGPDSVLTGGLDLFMRWIDTQGRFLTCWWASQAINRKM